MLQLNFSPFPQLATERLILRQLQPNDESEIFFLRSDERVNKYIDRPKAIFFEEAQNFILKINNSIKNNESIYWAICFKDQQQLVGTIVCGIFPNNLVKPRSVMNSIRTSRDEALCRKLL